MARMSVRVFTAEWEQTGALIDLRDRPEGPQALWAAVCAGAPQPRDAVTVAAPAPSVAQRLVGVVDAGPLQRSTGAAAVMATADALRAAVARADAAAKQQRAHISQQTVPPADAEVHAERIGRWAELAATAQAHAEQLQLREARAWRRRQGLKRRLTRTDAVGNEVQTRCTEEEGPPGRWPQPVCAQLRMLRRSATPAPVVIADAVAPATAAMEALRAWIAVPGVIVA